MARTVDLTRVAPNEATCYACGREVVLSRHARRARKFRCPFCHADNRLIGDGSTRPLSGEAETVDQMVTTLCRRCRAVNRLPAAVVRRRAFRCHACKLVQPVPRPILRAYGINSPWVIMLAVLSTLLVVAVAFAHVSEAARRYGVPWRDYGPRVNFPNREPVVLEQARPLPPTYEGNRFEARVRVFNSLDRPADYHVRAQVTFQGRVVASRTLTVRHLASGAWREVTITIVDGARQQVDALRVDVAGIS